MRLSLCTALVVALAISGCGQMRGLLGAGSAPPSRVQAPAAASLAEPAPGQPVTRQSTNWRDLPRNIPYVNMTSAPLPLYESENGGRAGSLPPGEGGYLQTCSDARPVCEITYDAAGHTAWVRMDHMGGVTN